jgi:autotransporter passenger strand-loop-strand repeat protein
VPIQEQAMQINVTYDPTFLSSFPNGVASDGATETEVENAIKSVVTLYDNLFSGSNVTVNLEIGWGEVGGTPITSVNDAAQNNKNTENFTYAQVSQALINNAQSAAQTEADQTLPAANSSIFGTGKSIVVTTADANALGLPLTAADTTFGTLSLDGYVGFNANLDWSFDPNSTPSGERDLIATAEHEISEVMGRSALVGAGGRFKPIDFFRYAYGAGGQPERDLTLGAAGSNATAFFSIDNGNTNLGTWNNDPKRGDPGDWKAGEGPAPQGADAFGPAPAGFVDRLTMNDVTLMNVIGWNTNDLPSPLNSGLTTVTNGLTDWISAGESASDIAVLSGGLVEVGSGGSAFLVTVSSGGSMYVDQGGLASYTSVTSVGFQLVSSGGLAEETSLDLGLQQIESGGTWFAADRRRHGERHVALRRVPSMGQWYRQQYDDRQRQRAAARQYCERHRSLQRRPPIHHFRRHRRRHHRLRQRLPDHIWRRHGQWHGPERRRRNRLFRRDRERHDDRHFR